MRHRMGRGARNTSTVLAAGVAFAGLGLHAGVASAAESRYAGDDVRVTVDEAGVARVEHAIVYRVSGMVLRGFDVNGVEPDAVIEEVAPITIDGEVANATAHVERKGEGGALRVSIDGAPKAGHGDKTRSYLVRVAYAVDLVKAGEVTLDGAMWKLAWTAPIAPEGYDGARVVFDVPAAPTEPRAITLDGAEGDDGRLVTLRRGPTRDELEMVRPHLSRAEAASWVARVDPRAFPRVTDATLRPPVTEAAPPARRDRAFRWLVVVAAGIAFGALARAKGRAVARAYGAAGVEARGVVPWSVAARAWGAGVAFAAAIACEMAGAPAWGALGVVAAMLFAAHRAPHGKRAPRGPGKWLALAPAEAFEVRRDGPASRLDVATRAGKGALALSVLGALAAGAALGRIDPSWEWLLPMDAAALLAIFATGSRASLPPDLARAPARGLASIHRALRRDETLRVAPWARLPLGASAPDELRLLVVPRAAMPGVVGIEVGVAWIPTPGGYAGRTEVLVRVRDDSAAAARLVALAPRTRAVTGRKPEERVVVLTPSSPTRAGALALVRRMAGELRDRREERDARAWEGGERRVPPKERLRGVMLAAATAV